ncbi:Ppx/GppA family phosphatase [Bacillus sp. Marseille-P3661]|uniref:Ppx/GppA family phosphatase n=1 Tax=Bacillus sp. Marseille-P3661 TaxID=1936234 RepID=UPI000C84958C|nr:Ppx/GppA family phosphatase [Bacillus sp. Marseille-P3661]
MNEQKYAIIDIGSNTVRLVIYSGSRSGRLKEIENVKVVARLRNYLSEDGILELEGLDVLLDALRGFHHVIRHHEIIEIKCVATATIRQAKNHQFIIEKVKEETDFLIEILSEYEEAFLGYLAVVYSTPFENGITIDIGGGSTEITLFKERKLLYYHSFPFGALSLKKQFITGQVPVVDELIMLREFLEEQFNTLEWPRNNQLPIIGIGGSARNMVQIHQASIEYPLAGVHQYMMAKKEIHQIAEWLESMTFSELQRVDGLSKDRADIIIPAVEVFRCLLEYVQSDVFALSRKGLRDGVFYHYLNKNSDESLPNVIETSLQELAEDFNINLDHVSQVELCAKQIARLLNNLGLASFTTHDLDLLKRGVFVYNVGTYIDTESSSQHTFYILANRTINGLLHKDQIILALIASFKSKDVFKRYLTSYKKWFTKEEVIKYRLIGAIINFAYSLNATKRDIIEEIDIKEKEGELTFYIICKKDWKPELNQVDKQKKHLEKQLNKSITVRYSFA